MGQPLKEERRDQLQELLSNALDALADLDDDARALGPHNVDRLNRVLEFGRANVQSSDHGLVSDRAYKQLRDALTSVGEQIGQDANTFVQRGIAQSIEDLSDAFNGLPSAGHLQEQDVAEIVSGVRERLEREIEKLQADLSGAKTRETELEELISAKETELKEFVEGKRSEADSQLQKLSTKVDEQATLIDQARTQHERQFREDQGKRDEKADAELEDFKTKAEAQREEFKTQAEETLKTLDENKEKAEKLVDLVSTSATAGAFNKEAEAQKKQADTWRKWAIGIGIAAAVVAIAAIIASFLFDTNTSVVVAKIAAVTLLIGLAGYAAGQSGQHRRREQRAKSLELQLVAFGPFVEPLGDDATTDNATAKDIVRKEFIERLFIGDPGEEHPDRDPRLSDENLSALGKIIDMIRSNPPTSGS